MENVTVGWIDKDERTSEENVPTLWIGQRNNQLGSRNDLNVLIMNGYERMSEGYIRSLEDTGYKVINADRQYRELSKKYSQLDRFGPYEKRCFLRWPLIQEFFGSSPVIHYDGDIVFNETPEHLASGLERFNVVIGGCPAVTSMRDGEWVSCFMRELDRFVADIEGYSAASWKMCDEGYSTNYSRWSGIRSRKTITSDQDLIRFIIQADLIPQDDPARVRAANEGLIFFDNPLFFFNHNMDCSPFGYRREGGIDYMGGKKVAFWHMQNAFTHYLRLVYLSRIKFNVPLRVDNYLELGDNGFITNTYNFLLTRMNPQIKRRMSRKEVCQVFFERTDFTHVFDPRTFWFIPKDQQEQDQIIRRFTRYN